MIKISDYSNQIFLKACNAGADICSSDNLFHNEMELGTNEYKKRIGMSKRLFNSHMMGSSNIRVIIRRKHKNTLGKMTVTMQDICTADITLI